MTGRARRRRQRRRGRHGRPAGTAPAREACLQSHVRGRRGARGACGRGRWFLRGVGTYGWRVRPRRGAGGALRQAAPRGARTGAAAVAVVRQPHLGSAAVGGSAGTAQVSPGGAVPSRLGGGTGMELFTRRQRVKGEQMRSLWPCAVGDRRARVEGARATDGAARRCWSGGASSKRSAAPRRTTRTYTGSRVGGRGARGHGRARGDAPARRVQQRPHAHTVLGLPRAPRGGVSGGRRRSSASAAGPSSPG